MALDLSYPIIPIYFEGTTELNEGDLYLPRLEA